MAEPALEVLAPLDQIIQAEFNDDEKKRWTTLRKAVDRVYTVDGRKGLLTDEHWDALLYVAQNYKALMQLPFDGIGPQQGFGARPIMIEDVTSAFTPDTATEWDHADAAAMAASRQLWLGDQAGAATLYAVNYLAANTQIIPRDAQDDHWGVAIVGAIDPTNQRLPKSISIQQAGEHKVEVPVESQFDVARNNLHAIPYADLGFLAWQPPRFGFAYGVRFRSLAAPGAVGGTGLRPVGLTFGTATRLRRTAAGANLPNRGTRQS